MEPPETDRREVCVRHGWVGRRLFLRDRHDLCEVPVSEDQDQAGHDEEDESNGETSTPPALEETTAPLPSKRRSRRRKKIPPKKTLAVRRITRLELAVGQAELEILGADEPYERPRSRGECSFCPVCQLHRDGNAEAQALDASGRLPCGHALVEVMFRTRPCLFVACKHALYLDVSEIGSIIFNFPDLEPNQMPMNRSCALDLADLGGMTLDQVGAAQAVTRERVRQIEVRALVELLARLKERGVDREAIVAVLMRHVAGPGELVGTGGIEGEVPSDVATLLGGGRK